MHYFLKKQRLVWEMEIQIASNKQEQVTEIESLLNQFLIKKMELLFLLLYVQFCPLMIIETKG